MSIEWNETLPAAFCEGKMIPYLVPGVYEFFSAITGGLLLFMGVFGLVQARLEIIMKMIYAGIVLSGFGTVIMHTRRWAAFNLLDTYPLLFTLTFGLFAFMDTVLMLYAPPLLDRAARPRLVARVLRAAEAIAYVLAASYLVAGLILVVYATNPAATALQRAFGYFFGVPYGVFAIGGLVLVHLTHPHRGDPVFRKLVPVLALAVSLGLLSCVFKVIDFDGCTSKTVWLFPHPLFHIFVTYSAHCFCVYLAFHRAYYSTYGLGPDLRPDVVWKWRLLPWLVIPRHSPAHYLGMPPACKTPPPTTSSEGDALVLTPVSGRP